MSVTLHPAIAALVRTLRDDARLTLDGPTRIVVESAVTGDRDLDSHSFAVLVTDSTYSMSPPPSPLALQMVYRTATALLEGWLVGLAAGRADAAVAAKATACASLLSELWDERGVDPLEGGRVRGATLALDGHEAQLVGVALEAWETASAQWTVDRMTDPALGASC